MALRIVILMAPELRKLLSFSAAKRNRSAGLDMSMYFRKRFRQIYRDLFRGPRPKRKAKLNCHLKRREPRGVYIVDLRGEAAGRPPLGLHVSRWNRQHMK
jgi:hypothetical protein